MRKAEKNLEDFYLGIIVALNVVACVYDQDTIAGEILNGVDAKVCLKVAREHDWPNVARFIRRWMKHRKEHEQFLERQARKKEASTSCAS